MHYELRSKYVPIPVTQIATSFCKICLICIFSVVTFGKKIVKNIPIANTKIGWNDSVSKTNPTGASKYENATIIFPEIYKNSFKKFNDKTRLELLIMADIKFSR